MEFTKEEEKQRLINTKRLINNEITMEGLAIENKEKNKIKSNKYVGKCYFKEVSCSYIYFSSINKHGLLNYSTVRMSDHVIEIYQGSQMGSWVMDGYKEISKGVFEALLKVALERMSPSKVKRKRNLIN